MATHSAEWPLLAKELCTRLGYDKVTTMCTGAEAADTACKIARKWGITYKKIAPEDVLILGTSDNYHGLTSGIWPIMNPLDQSGKLNYPRIKKDMQYLTCDKSMVSSTKMLPTSIPQLASFFDMDMLRISKQCSVITIIVLLPSSWSVFMGYYRESCYFPSSRPQIFLQKIVKSCSTGSLSLSILTE